MGVPHIKNIRELDEMTLFKQYRQPNGSHNPLGNRRVYSTKWLNTWVNWEREHAMTGPSGEYLESIRYRPNGKHGIHKRKYVDMSIAYIDLDMVGDRVLTWDKGITTDPADSKYLRKHYVNGKSLKELAHMSTNDFLRFIESLPGKRTNPNRTGKRR